jgi:hypothetical protein
MRNAPHRMRNNPITIRQMQQFHFRRSAQHLSSAVRQEARELSGAQLRELKPRNAYGTTKLEDLAGPKMQTRAAVGQMLEEIAKRFLARNGQDVETIIRPIQRDDGKKEFLGRIATGAGIVRDADGNVVLVDSNDRPYVLVSNGEIVYVRVYSARINPKGQRLDAQCTVENPDGLEEVILVEPLPSIGPANDPHVG